MQVKHRFWGIDYIQATLITRLATPALDAIMAHATASILVAGAAPDLCWQHD